MSGRAETVFRAARNAGYAVGAFNAVNLETAQAIVAAAEAERSPVLLAFSENATRYAGLESLAAIGHSLRDAATVPVLLHFDHAASVGSAHRALEAGFDTLMLETDGDPRDDPEVARLAREAEARGAWLELEADVVPKGARRSDAAPRSPAEVADLVAATGCRLLAIDLGTEHKGRDKTARLDLERAHAVRSATDAVLVLHGASSVGEDELRRAVAAGVGKVNVGTDLMLAFTAAVRERLAAPERYDLRDYLGAGRAAMQRRVRALMQVLGSSGRSD